MATQGGTDHIDVRTPGRRNRLPHLFGGAGGSACVRVIV
jgi:hypothetical protein